MPIISVMVDITLPILFSRACSHAPHLLLTSTTLSPQSLSPPVVSLLLVWTCWSADPSGWVAAVVSTLPLCVSRLLLIPFQLASLSLYCPGFLSEFSPCMADLILENRQDRCLLTRPDSPLMARKCHEPTVLLFPGKLLYKCLFPFQRLFPASPFFSRPTLSSSRRHCRCR